MGNLKTFFLETYHSIYCRAKSIMHKEEDALALMKEVYLLAAEAGISDESAKAWMVREIYTLGCGKFRKKKAREAEVIELQEQEYTTQKGVDCEKTKSLICETLQELPDLYQATLFAFYYDQYSVSDVAAITGYSEGVILNRLNYIHKYLSKKLEDYQEENKVNVQFSVEIVYEALGTWVSENTLDETVTQNLYSNICRELDLPVENLFEDEVSAVAVKESGVEAVKQELQAYSVKTGLDKKQIFMLAVIVGGLAILALVAILLLGNRDKKNEPKDNQPAVENQVDEEEEEPSEVDDTEENDSEGDTSEEETSQDDEYILPNSDTVKLTRADLQGLSKEELRLARNEIFARHGMIFGADDLKQYFATKSWYEPTVAYDDFYNVVEMNMIEEANLVLISAVEEEME